MAQRSARQALTIEGIDLAADGAGYGTLDGRRVLVDGVIPGERVEVEPAAAGGGEGTALRRLSRVVEPSTDRVAAACRYFGPCGGCSLQHIAYPAQLRLKTERLQSVLREALGDLAPRVAPMRPTSPPWAYRDKVHFVFAERPGGGLALGHYRRRSRAPVIVEECPVHAPAGNETACAVRDALDAAGVRAAGRGGGVARHVVVRVSEGTGERLATLVVAGTDRRLRAAVRRLAGTPGAPAGLHLNVHDRPDAYLFGPETLRLAGADRIRETVAGTVFLLSPTAFFQTNVRAADRIARLVAEHAAHAALAFDLYAGVGLFALPLARGGARVVAIEENADSVKDGEASRRLNRIPEAACRFVRARAEDVARGRARPLPARPDLVVLDPPRAGCPRAVLAWLSGGLRPARIIYVSCSPEALGRDLRALLRAGYRATLVQPVDMFPHTPHIETLVVLDGATA